jgi:hypothetical protein
MSVLLVASPENASGDPTSSEAGSPSAAKTATRIEAPAFSRYNSVKVEIGKVMVHNTIAGWLELNTNSGVYELMSLRHGESKALVDRAELAPGTYDKIALTLGTQNSIIIDLDNYNLKSEGVPTPELAVRSEVLSGKNTEITIDFNAFRSISCVDYGCFVLNPLISVKEVSVK